MTYRTHGVYGPCLEVMTIAQASTRFTEHGHYRIRIAGLLDATLSSRFEGMTISADMGAGAPPTTVLEGCVADRAALHGMLDRIRDLNLQLISVQRVQRP